MPDGAATEAMPADSAAAALAFVAEMSPDLRAAAILDDHGRLLASTGEGSGWGEATTALFAAADAAGGEPVEQVHVADEAGEVFAIRLGSHLAVAVTDRFALASLLLFDLRSALHALAAEAGQG